jgi:hypothetical protein
MSRNPYAQPPIGPEAAIDYVEPSRVSALAISSLVFGILCCIPGFGLISTILGGASLINISRAEGRLSGRGFALTGLVLGLVGSLFWIATVFGVSLTINEIGRYGPVVKAFQTGDRTTARAALSASAVAKLTDDRASEFGNEITKELGDYDRTPKGIIGWLKGYAEVSDTLSNITGGGRPSDGEIPFPLYFKNGVALVMAHLDSSAAQSGRTPLKNLSIHTKSGKVIWLFPPETPGSTPSTATPSSPPASPSTAPPADPAKPDPAKPDPAKPESKSNEKP